MKLVITHRHEYGTDIKLATFEGSKTLTELPSEETIADILGIDFEPHKGEELEVDTLCEEEIVSVAFDTWQARLNEAIVIQELIPCGSFVTDDFSNNVKGLARPYRVINSSELEWLESHGVDVFKDARGRPFTYGDADGGHALMPISDPSIFAAGKTS